MCENLNTTDYITPVDPDKLHDILINCKYDKLKTKYLVDGFRNGFNLGYRGNFNITKTAPNLKFTIGNKIELWNKIMKEVANKRYAGPFKTPPFKHFIQSPIGLVPKDGGKATRLIFHLSYPRVNVKEGAQLLSVNANTPKELTKVNYPDVADAIRLCLVMGRNCKVGKSDMKSAFRHFPINRRFWQLLVMKAQSPVDGEWYYFFDKAMPFGAAISCAHFQEFSNAIAYVITYISGKLTINYLDDYFFAGILKSCCDQQLTIFLQVCASIGFPVADEKTVWGTTTLTFLGFLSDTARQLVLIPVDKIERALELINELMRKPKRKATLKEIQKLCGVLNFFGRCNIPGRAFTRRLYALTANLTKPHHHVRINSEAILDLMTWKTFLQNPAAFSRSFGDFSVTWTADEIDMYSDSSLNPNLGCGGISGREWFMLKWQKDFILNKKPSIAFLELYAVTIAVTNWIHKYKNRKIALFCDNMSAVHMINKTSSSCKNCMILIRMIVLQGLIHNVRITAKHVTSKANVLSDHLSRLRYDQFKQLTGDKYLPVMTKIPDHLWPMDKVWIN